MTEVVSRKPRGPPIADVFGSWYQQGLRNRLKQAGLPDHFVAELKAMNAINSSVADSLPGLEFCPEFRAAEIEEEDLSSRGLDEKAPPLKVCPVKHY